MFVVRTFDICRNFGNRLLVGIGFGKHGAERNLRIFEQQAVLRIAVGVRRRAVERHAEHTDTVLRLDGDIGTDPDEIVIPRSVHPFFEGDDGDVGYVAAVFYPTNGILRSVDIKRDFAKNRPFGIKRQIGGNLSGFEIPGVQALFFAVPAVERITVFLGIVGSCDIAEMLGKRGRNVAAALRVKRHGVADDVLLRGDDFDCKRNFLATILQGNGKISRTRRAEIDQFDFVDTLGNGKRLGRTVGLFDQNLHPVVVKRLAHYISGLEGTVRQLDRYNIDRRAPE